MVGTLIFFGIWVGVIALILERRESNRETKEHHVVKRNFYTAYSGELWPRIKCSCGHVVRGPTGMGLWLSKLEAKGKMNQHIRGSKKKVPTEW